jgi:hypothetical protein
MSLTIAQALKEKNKKLEQLNKLWKRLGSNNSVVEGSVREYNPEELLAQLHQETAAFVELKTRIHNSCSDVRDKIFRLSELKTFVKRLKTIDTSPRMHRDRYEGVVLKYEVFYTEGAMDRIIEQVELEIETTQEFLDHYNHTNYLK